MKKLNVQLDWQFEWEFIQWDHKLNWNIWNMEFWSWNSTTAVVIQFELGPKIRGSILVQNCWMKQKFRNSNRKIRKCRLLSTKKSLWTIFLYLIDIIYCSILKIKLIFFFLQIPETPQWLLSKNRTTEAEKSLRWLRGWVSSEAVAQEFHDLQRHSERSKSCNTCIKKDLKCTHPLPTMREKFAELKRKRTLKPFGIVISLFFLAQFSGILSMRSEWQHF